MLYRSATFADVEAIYELINVYAAKGVMLARSRNTLYETLRDFIVAEKDGCLIGVGAVHIVWEGLVEIRALAVAPEHTRTGVGRSLVTRLIDEARHLGTTTVFALTYQPDFFATLGFHEVPKETLSHKVWKECINCAKFPNCDEIAVVKQL